MKLRTKSDFSGPYWENGGDHRWDAYLHKAVRLVRELRPGTVLEIGTNGVGICVGSDTIGIDPKTKPTILHDITRAPWPCYSKAYDLGIATQVWEHLRGGQQAAFTELQRVCRYAILSFPYMWESRVPDDHSGIDKARIDEWTNHHRYIEEYILGDRRKRLMRLYRF